jgi:hypothetical protein
MNSRLRGWQSLLAAVVLWAGLLVSLLAAPAYADPNPNPRVLPPNSRPYGSTYGEWGVKWTQWAFALPTSVNPNLADGNVDCSVGQTGRVWFLAVVFNLSGTATRSCTIPSGTALFFPILTAGNNNIATDPPLTAEELMAVVREILSFVTDLHVSIDGQPLHNLSIYRAPAPAPYALTVPAQDNLWQYFGLDVPGADWPSTTIEPSVSDGFWLFLAPLPPGPHVITFGATIGPPIFFTFETTYHLTVQDHRR